MAFTVDEQKEHLQLLARRAHIQFKELVLPQDKHVQGNGLRIHYLDWGTNGKRPILFVHGGGLTAHAWDMVCLDLRADYHCLAMDMRGHGDSEWSPNADYSYESQAGDVEGVVDGLGLKDFILVGHSMGGLNTLIYSSKHSEKIACYVLIECGPDANMGSAEGQFDFYRATTEFDSVDDFVQRVVAYRPHSDPKMVRLNLMHNLRKLPSGKWTWKYDPRRHPDYSVERLTNLNRGLWKYVPSVTCRTLVVRGGKSQFFLPKHAEDLAGRLPSARWTTVENAAHNVQSANPKGLLREMRSFFQEVGV